MSEKGIVHLRCAEIRTTQPPAVSEFPPQNSWATRVPKMSGVERKIVTVSFLRFFQLFRGRGLLASQNFTSRAAAPASIRCQQCGQIKT
jgi:hypothetical protein